MTKLPDAAGGFHAIKYTWHMARRVGIVALYQAMKAKNACKTCALGMGGQKGGMRNEMGKWPELCKKSLQAMVADMQGVLKPDFFKAFSINQMESLSSRELESAGRLTSPMYHQEGSTHYVPITWDQAYEKIASKLLATSPDRTFWYFSGRSSNEAGFLLQLLAREYGTNNINNCSYYCHQASGVGLNSAMGTGTASVKVDDIDHCKLFLLFGANPPSNHPRLMTHLMHLKRNGGKIIVVNPIKETGLVKFKVPSDMRSLFFGTKIADDYVQIKAGGDIALIVGISKRILELNAQDHGFINKATDGFAEFEKYVNSATWVEIEESTGVLRGTIESLGDQIKASDSTILSWAMGITHHLHGVENVQWISNLALLCGLLGKPHAGLLPLRGHSNVQGMGTMGVMPQLKPAIAERFKLEGLAYPESKGLDTMGCMDEAYNGNIDFGISLGGNLFGSNPDAQFAKESLAEVGMMVYVNTTMNTGHLHGRGKDTLILPVLARDEEPYKTTQESMFSFVRLSDGGEARYKGPMPEVHLIVEIAKRVLKSSKNLNWDDFKSTDRVRSLIARTIPNMSQIEKIAMKDGEFHIPGRSITEARFPTKNGKAKFNVSAIPKREATKYPLTLITLRSEGQFNTVVYEEEDFYRGQERRDVVLMNPKTMEKMGFEKDQRVSIKSDTGEMKNILVRPFDIQKNAAAMYYPESNVLVSRKVDKASLTPAFKNTPILISKMPMEQGVRQDALGGNKVTKTAGTSTAAHLVKKSLRPKLNQC